MNFDLKIKFVFHEQCRFPDGSCISSFVLNTKDILNTKMIDKKQLYDVCCHFTSFIHYKDLNWINYDLLLCFTTDVFLEYNEIESKIKSIILMNYLNKNN